MATSDGGPAFPYTKRPYWGFESDMLTGAPEKVLVCETSEGMSLRDWFAGQALAGILSSVAPYSGHAEDAYDIADAMLRAREGRRDG